MIALCKQIDKENSAVSHIQCIELLILIPKCKVQNVSALQKYPYLSFLYEGQKGSKAAYLCV